jgi:hypothetical protein
VKVSASVSELRGGPPLSGVLSVLLPTEAQTLLLRACLQGGEEGRRAWSLWLARPGDPRRRLTQPGRGSKAILSLLYNSIRDDGRLGDRALLTLLRTAYAREELRSRRVVQLFRESLSALAAAGVEVIVLKGTALAGTLYGDWALRHCHDIDLLVRRGDLLRAVRALSAVGSEPAHGAVDPTAHEVGLSRPDGMPVRLHSRPFRLLQCNLAIEEMWARSEPRTLAGVAVRVLSPADGLLHVCGTAAYWPSRALLLWVCDAWQIIRGMSPRDWDLLLETAPSCHLSLPLYVMLHYLRGELGAAIPSTALEALAVQAGADPAGREGALYGAQATPEGELVALLRRARGGERELLFQWVVRPSSNYLYSLGESRSSRMLPVRYSYHLLKAILPWRLKQGPRWMMSRIRPGRPLFA